MRGERVEGEGEKREEGGEGVEGERGTQRGEGERSLPAVLIFSPTAPLNTEFFFNCTY